MVFTVHSPHSDHRTQICCNICFTIIIRRAERLKIEKGILGNLHVHMLRFGIEWRLTTEGTHLKGLFMLEDTLAFLLLNCHFTCSSSPKWTYFVERKKCLAFISFAHFLYLEVPHEMLSFQFSLAEMNFTIWHIWTETSTTNHRTKNSNMVLLSQSFFLFFCMFYYVYEFLYSNSLHIWQSFSLYAIHSKCF